MNPGKITLSIQMDQAGRSALQTYGQRIVLVRAMTGDSDFVVACAVLDPFGDETDILFYPQWEVFVMQGKFQSLETVRLQQTQAMAPGQQCPFEASGFGAMQPAYSKTVFGLTNKNAAGPLSAGLAQWMNVANEDVWQPIAIAGFPYNETSYFEPKDEVLVFLAKGIVAGEVLPAGLLQPEAPPTAAVQPVIVSPYLRVSLAADATVHFDDADNCFRPGPPAG